MLFDADGKIKRYESPEEILMEFFDLRLQYYERRRVSLLQARRPPRGRPVAARRRPQRATLYFPPCRPGRPSGAKALH